MDLQNVNLADPVLVFFSRGEEDHLRQLFQEKIGRGLRNHRTNDTESTVARENETRRVRFLSNYSGTS